MPPQIKHDVNRSGWETTDMPSVCERCLPDNPYVQMTKEDYGAECKICTRPFTVFRWKADRTSRQKRSIICLTCARLKNCCQCCMLDLSFGLPVTIRDAALKMIAPGPESSINREYYAQNHEKEIEEGRGAIEDYQKTDEKAMELLRRIADSDHYSKRRRIADDEEGQNMKALPAPDNLRGDSAANGVSSRSTVDGSREGARGGMRGGRGGRRGGRPFPSTAQLPPSEEDWLPPDDRNIKSLFVVGVEDDLPEYKIREFFEKFGRLQSVVCSHRAHCAYINYNGRKSAEEAANGCRGRAVVAGCPLRVTWGKPKTLDTTDREERMANARAGRDAVGPAGSKRNAAALTAGDEQGQAASTQDLDGLIAAPPPGQDEVNYASMAGD
ncbi:MAG: Pre-mRNA-splicing factor slt11 [Chrysothrix sp. TS-e1954]|nr:MAG: Pre-mRNA-splicing factor slt11 [Chrysothrix sp. TS-e1954]